MKNPLLIIALSITLLSCSKDPGDDFSKQDALTTGTWKLTGAGRDYNKDGVYEEDIYGFIQDCFKDNIYTFQADGNLVTDDGPTKCNSGNSQTTTIPWSFINNQSQLQFGGKDYQIQELTTTTLRLKVRVPYNVIYTMDVQTTYTKQ